MNNIMLDLETFGNKPGCVIVAIGAVRFGGGELGEEFYQRIEAESCVRAGLKLDVATVLWWMKQSDEARAELNKPGSLIGDALLDFNDYAHSSGRKLLVWGNGSDFDNIILASAYEACNQPLPWKFWDNRCYRTVKNLHPEIKLEISADKKHNALEDAKAQALHLMQMLPGI